MQNNNEYWDEHPSAEDHKTLERRLGGIHKRIYMLQRASEVLLDEFNKVRHMHAAIGDNLKTAYDASLEEIKQLCANLGDSVDFLQKSAQMIEQKRKVIPLVRPE